MKKMIAKVVIIMIIISSFMQVDWKEILKEENSLKYNIAKGIESAREKNGSHIE